MLPHVVICPRMEWMRCFVHMMGLTRYAAVVIRAYYFVCAKFLVRTRALIPACRFSVVPVVLWSCRAYMFLTRAKYSAYLLSASSLAVGLLLSFVCVPWEPDPSLEPMGVLHLPGTLKNQPSRLDPQTKTRCKEGDAPPWERTTPSTQTEPGRESGAHNQVSESQPCTPIL